MLPAKLVVVAWFTVRLPLPRLTPPPVPAKRAHGLAAILEIEDAAIDDERRGRREAAAGIEPQRAGIDRGGAGIGTGAGEAQQPGAGLGQAALAGDDAVELGRVRLVDGEGGVTEHDRADAAGDDVEPRHGLVVAVEIEGPAADGEETGRSQAAAGCQLQRAGVDRGGAGVGAGAGEAQRPDAGLGQAAGAGDAAGEAREVVALVHGEVAIAQIDAAAGAGEGAHGLAAVLDIEQAAIDGERGGRRQAAAGSELQRAGVDRGGAGVAAGAGEDQRSGTGLDQAAGAADAAGKGRGRGRGLVHGQAASTQVDDAAGAGE